MTDQNSLSACARCSTYEEALRQTDRLFGAASWLVSECREFGANSNAVKVALADFADIFDATRVARAALASSGKQEKGKGLGGSAAARSGGGS